MIQRSYTHSLRSGPASWRERTMHAAQRSYFHGQVMMTQIESSWWYQATTEFARNNVLWDHKWYTALDFGAHMFTGWNEHQHEIQNEQNEHHQSAEFTSAHEIRGPPHGSNIFQHDEFNDITSNEDGINENEVDFSGTTDDRQKTLDVSSIQSTANDNTGSTNSKDQAENITPNIDHIKVDNLFASHDQQSFNPEDAQASAPMNESRSDQSNGASTNNTIMVDEFTTLTNDGHNNEYQNTENLFIERSGKNQLLLDSHVSEKTISGETVATSSEALTKTNETLESANTVSYGQTKITMNEVEHSADINESEINLTHKNFVIQNLIDDTLETTSSADQSVSTTIEENHDLDTFHEESSCEGYDISEGKLLDSQSIPTGNAENSLQDHEFQHDRPEEDALIGDTATQSSHDNIDKKVAAHNNAAQMTDTLTNNGDANEDEDEDKDEDIDTL